MQHGFKLVLETILLASDMGLPIFFLQCMQYQDMTLSVVFHILARYIFQNIEKQFDEMTKQTSNIFFWWYTSPRSAYNKILQYLQDSGHNDDNNENYKNYLHRGPCRQDES